jgi:hypothetical protein
MISSSAATSRGSTRPPCTRSARFTQRRCARSSPHRTPALGDPIRKGQRRPKLLVLAGFDRTAAVYGRDCEVQAGETILMFEMAGLHRTHRLPDATTARTAYEAALRDEPEIHLDDVERRMVDFLCSPTPDGEDPAGVLAGASWLIGAAFCPRVRDVQAMEAYAEAKNDFYFQLASRFLFDPEAMAGWDSEEADKSTVAVSWFRSRNPLPAVLSAWLEDGRRLVRPEIRQPGHGQLLGPRSRALTPRSSGARQQRRFCEDER